MLRPELARLILDLATEAALPSDSKRHAVMLTVRIARFSAGLCPSWWAWTSWLAAAITIGRIESA